MISWAFKKIFGNKNTREIKRLLPLVEEINRIEKTLTNSDTSVLQEKIRSWQQHLHRYLALQLPTKKSIAHMSSEELTECAAFINERFDSLRDEFPQLSTVAANTESIEKARKIWHETEYFFTEKRAKYLEKILPEAYAVIKNMARKLCNQEVVVRGEKITWNMIHFDVQLLGGIALHKGFISEMQTGEGKTLVATLPICLNALTGLGVHVITVNDYLAQRDSEWMSFLYKSLGLSCGCLTNNQHPNEKRAAYQCDITYGTNSEFGFDYLRDNGMARASFEQVQRSHYFAIIDEVDSVLIDEARTPLIISGEAEVSNVEQYADLRPAVEKLTKQQNNLCATFLQQAKELLDEGKQLEAGKTFFKVHLGSPNSRQLQKIKQDIELRKLIDQAELSFYQDAQKKELFAVKEELFYIVDPKTQDADLTDKGREFLSPKDPNTFLLPDLATILVEIDTHTDYSEEKKQQLKAAAEQDVITANQRVHALSQLLKAYCLYDKGKDYIVQNNEVIIIDEQTGRQMDGRRWSDGLHQAVEAKEKVTIQEETQTYATITIQNYFRIYQKLAGMTGTAETEAAEFHDIYRLDVLPIPTNVPNQRIDLNDQIFRTRREKYNAVVEHIRKIHQQGQPILIGTDSVESSETLSRLLKRARLPHSVLNAKHHQQEANIVAQAGKKGAITVSTNMAGRGTDIKLDPAVKELGGLFVIGCERYESRRVDRQLRGRCARQGDPGVSQFYVSFEDTLMLNFTAANRMTALLNRFGVADGEPIEHALLNRTVETAQKRVEQRNYTGRKRILEFDDVMNKQREIIYGLRNDILRSDDPESLFNQAIREALEQQKYEEFFGNNLPPQEQRQQFTQWVATHFSKTGKNIPSDCQDNDTLFQQTAQLILQEIAEKMASYDPRYLDAIQRKIMIMSIDRLWKEHLYHIDSLREGIFLRAQGQKDPLLEYKSEAFSLFDQLMADIYEDYLIYACIRKVRFSEIETFLIENNIDQNIAAEQVDALMSAIHEAEAAEQKEQAQQSSIKLNLPQKETANIKIKPNQPCPCGSNKKFKQCCGKLS